MVQNWSYDHDKGRNNIYSAISIQVRISEYEKSKIQGTKLPVHAIFLGPETLCLLSVTKV